MPKFSKLQSQYRSSFRSLLLVSLLHSSLLAGCTVAIPLATRAPAEPLAASSIVLDAEAALGARFALHHARRRPLAVPDVPYEDVRFNSEDGVPLAAWYIPAAVATHKTIVAVHGHADSRYAFLRDGQLAMWHDQYNVMAVDLRNNGDSGGQITTFGLYERRDVVAAVKYAEARGAADIGLYGISMGAVSCLYALETLPEVKSIMLDCPYASVRVAFTGFASASWAPDAVVLGAAILNRCNAEVGGDLADAEGRKHIVAVGARPLWMVHGLADQLVLPDESQTLLALAPTPDKSLWLVPGAGHGQSVNVARDEYRTRMQAFLARTL